jgi:hypothetical protein
MAGIAATFGSSSPEIGHGACAQSDHAAGDVTPGAQAAWRAIEKRTWLSGIVIGTAMEWVIQEEKSIVRRI